MYCRLMAVLLSTKRIIVNKNPLIASIFWSFAKIIIVTYTLGYKSHIAA